MRRASATLHLGRWARRQVERVSGWPLVWRTLRRVIEGNWVNTAAVIGQFSDGGELWLDVGCGEAPLARLFPPDRYLGLDLNPDRLRRAQDDNPGHRFAEADARAWACPGASIDRLLMVHLLHHLSDG